MGGELIVNQVELRFNSLSSVRFLDDNHSMLNMDMSEENKQNATWTGGYTTKKQRWRG